MSFFTILKVLLTKFLAMKYANKILMSALLVVASLVACNKDDDDDDNVRCGDNWSPAVELEDEINAITAAAQTYGMDPSMENCEAYKQSLLDYLDAIRSWEDCYVHIGQQAEFNRQVDEAEQDVMNIQC